MKTLIATIVGIITWLGGTGWLYLLGAFIATDINFVNWSQVGRMTLGMFFIFPLFIGVFVFLHVKEEGI
jgi:hypothetical protein